MKRRVYQGACALLTGGVCLAAAAQFNDPDRRGDAQNGSFGDPDRGNFGDMSSGHFVENNFSRKQEGEMAPLVAVPLRAGRPSLFAKPPISESPYVTLPKPDTH